MIGLVMILAVFIGLACFGVWFAKAERRAREQREVLFKWLMAVLDVRMVRSISTRTDLYKINIPGWSIQPHINKRDRYKKEAMDLGVTPYMFTRYAENNGVELTPEDI